MRNSKIPSWRPFRVWTMTSPSDTRGGAAPLLHLALVGVGVDVIGEYPLDDLRLVFAVGALGRLDQIEILDRIVVDAELELAAQRNKVRLLQTRAQRVLV